VKTKEETFQVITSQTDALIANAIVSKPNGSTGCFFPTILIITAVGKWHYLFTTIIEMRLLCTAKMALVIGHRAEVQ